MKIENMQCKKGRNKSIRNLKLLNIKCPLAHLIMNNFDGFLSIRNYFHRNVKFPNGLLSHLIDYKYKNNHPSSSVASKTH